MSKLRLKLLLIMYKCNAGECRKKTVKAKTTYSDVGPGNCVLMTPVWVYCNPLVVAIFIKGTG